MLELAGKSAALKRWLAENEAKKVDGAHARSPHCGAVCMPLRDAHFMD